MRWPVTLPNALKGLAAAVVVVLGAGAAVTSRPPAVEPGMTPPRVDREFRGAWIATVANINWPSKPGLGTEAQQQELVAILDQAKALNLNAVIFQVRPAGDAFYESRLEPWSEYLTGEQGKAPEPFYDPLAFAVAEAHKRGIELHAWFNPFRARHATSREPVSPRHITQTHPHLVRRQGKDVMLDPGERSVQVHVRNVILDVLRRYDVDGVHMDDYFYPYPPVPGEFPDDPAWNRYVAGGGRLSRADWRRENINTFVRETYQAVKAQKPWVKFGISPFGIWRPNHPPGTEGMDAYAGIFADSKKWLNEGWVDYMAPQLYWRTDQRERSFPNLLRWWAGENHKHRHLWPGMNASRLGAADPDNWAASEILGQIELTRRQIGCTGQIHYNIAPLLENRRGIAAGLQQGAYAEPALIPASLWLNDAKPEPPRVRFDTAAAPARAQWAASGTEPVDKWVVQMRYGNRWRTEIVPGSQGGFSFPGGRPDAIAVSAANRYGNLSAPTLAR